ncbi:MAG: TIM-barrel domain-containing protein [Candidatus Hydrogenedentota bacterium]
MNRWLKRGLILLLILFILGSGGIYFYWMLPFWGIPMNASRHTQVPLTPEWALEPWLWEDDINTAEEVRRLLDGYREHDIPAHTIMIDSPWSTRYNDFSVDETRYPDPEKFFTGLQNDGYRVVLWMTCFVNSKNKDTAIQNDAKWYEEARDKGYLAGSGEKISWWKGAGGLIDYTNPEAMEWWHGMQQQLFDWGLDGWKLDGTATYAYTPLFDKLPLPYKKTSEGWMTTRGYMDHYYRDEYQHGLTQNPEFITLARAQDNQSALVRHPEGFAPLDAAPVTWVGDQDHTWTAEEEGMEEAVRDILASAKQGYSIIGSDIGGYGGSEIPPKLYMRWAQFSTFCGLFLNGGHGQRALWDRSDEELEVIRKFAWLHSELVPYIYTHMVRAHRGGKPLMRPSGADYEYFFGDDFYVAPIYSESDERAVKLPAGEWRYFFDSERLIRGGTMFIRDYPMDEAPVFVRDGAIIPMNVSRDYTGFGDAESKGHLTLLIYRKGTKTTMIPREGKDDLRVEIIVEGLETRIDLPESDEKFLLRLENINPPYTVYWNGEEGTEEITWDYDPEARRLVIRQNVIGAGTLSFMMPR